MNPTLHRLFLIALVAGSAMNLAAGVRRPLIERRKLSQGYYPAADRAAAAIRRLVPPDAALSVVGYDDDIADQIHVERWIDYRLKWLLYPRSFQEYRLFEDGKLQRRSNYEQEKANYDPAAGLIRPGYALFFRASRPVVAPDSLLLPGTEILTREPSFLLVYLP